MFIIWSTFDLVSNFIRVDVRISSQKIAVSSGAAKVSSKEISARKNALETLEDSPYHVLYEAYEATKHDLDVTPNGDSTAFQLLQVDSTRRTPRVSSTSAS